MKLCSQAFRKATRSQSGGECTECARQGGKVFLRDSKVDFGSDGDNIIVLDEADFDAFQADVRAGIAVTRGLAIIGRDGDFVVRRQADGEDATELVFSKGEIEAFIDGVHKREFDAESTHAEHAPDCVHREVELVTA
jgi:hypothetical protein